MRVACASVEIWSAHSRSVMPIQRFPAELFEFKPDVVILTVAMGAVDARAAVEAFAGRVGRIVLLSSGDVYRAYGRFTGTELGPIDKGLLTEDAPLRSVLFPYRHKASSPEALEYWYEKILAERAVLNALICPGRFCGYRKCMGQEVMRISQRFIDIATIPIGAGPTVL